MRFGIVWTQKGGGATVRRGRAFVGRGGGVGVSGNPKDLCYPLYYHGLSIVYASQASTTVTVTSIVCAQYITNRTSHASTPHPAPAPRMHGPTCSIDYSPWTGGGSSPACPGMSTGESSEAQGCHGLATPDSGPSLDAPPRNILQRYWGRFQAQSRCCRRPRHLEAFPQ